MTAFYENLPLFKHLYDLCRRRGLRFDPETGDRFSFCGRESIVAAALGNSLALVDDLCPIPLDAARIVYVHEWESNPDCFPLPRLEQLLEIIRSRSSLYPILTPGVKETRSVWQVSHPNAPPIVNSDLERGLLELAIRVLEGE